jgi:hypothetical protein
MRYKKGTFAKSLAGHDKDEVYLIVKSDNKYIYLANGKNRTLENPKRKKLKHVQWIGTVNTEIALKIENAEKISSCEIKRAIQLVLGGM